MLRCLLDAMDNYDEQDEGTSIEVADKVADKVANKSAQKVLMLLYENGNLVPVSQTHPNRSKCGWEFRILLWF